MTLQVCMRSTNPSEKSGLKKLLLLAFLLCAFSLAVVGMAAWFFIKKVEPAFDPMVRLKSALETLTHQEVTQSGHSLELRTDQIRELSVIEREMQSMTKYEGTFFKSKKMIILKGTFKVKAGFNLNEASTFSLVDGEISGDPPPAQILSVELLDYEVYHSQDGLINKLQAEDQEKATEHLLSQARKDAEASDLKEKAEAQFKQRLSDLMHSPAL